MIRSCFGCVERHMNCHARCPRYAADPDKDAKRRESERSQREYANYKHAVSDKVVRYLRSKERH
jgi:hypothetical protein